MGSHYDEFNNAGRSGGEGEAAGHRVVPGRYDRIAIPMGPLKVWTRLIPGAYSVTEWPEAGKPVVKEKPLHEGRLHGIQKKDGKWDWPTCLRGLNQYMPPEECPLCYFLEGRDANSSWFAAHTALGLWNYHKVERAPKPGTNQKKTYTNLVPCEATHTNPNCKMCASKYPWQLGYLGHFRTNWTEYGVLMTLNAEMGTHCVCGGTIITRQAACPTCHSVLAGIESGMSDAEFHRFLANKQVCPTCRAIVKVVPVRQCTGCAEPRPLSIYDANINLWREEVSGTKIFKGEITSWGPLDPAYGTVEPLDLPAIYAPEPRGRMMQRVPRHRQIPENANDPNAVARNPMEAAAAAAMASGQVRTPPLPPGVFGPAGGAQAPAPMPSMPPSSNTQRPVAGPPMPPGVFNQTGAMTGRVPTSGVPPAMPAPVQPQQAAPQAQAFQPPPELPPEMGDLGVDDNDPEEG